MKKLTFSIPLLIIPFVSYCQDAGYREGMVIMQAGDTIHCLVPQASSFGSKVRIKKNANAVEEYVPLNTIKYLANSDNIYENIGYEQKGKEVHKLMWLEIEGRLNLYLEVVMNFNASNTNALGTFTSYRPLKTYVIRKNTDNYLIENKNFEEVILPLIAENETLVRSVKEKKYTLATIEALVKEYNSSTSKN